jgi:methionine biosynthesis protein MetW
MRADLLRPDHAAIYDLVDAGARVLDLGCGDGELLALLVEGKRARGQGIEVDDQAIYRCVARGLSVFHGDIDSGLPDYPDGSFDFVILNKSLQEVKHVDYVLREALRVGRKVIVGIPNFASLGARARLFFGGRMPVTRSLPYQWHDTPNLRFLTIKDFQVHCRELGITVLEARCFGKRGHVPLLPNLFALEAVFLLGSAAGDPARLRRSAAPTALR